MSSNGIPDDVYDIETTTTSVMRDDQDDDGDEVVLFSKRRRRSRPSSSQRLNYGVEVVEHVPEVQASIHPTHQLEPQVEPQLEPYVAPYVEPYVAPQVDVELAVLPKPVVPAVCTRCDFKELNIPEAVINQWKERGISKLHPWQLECLKVDNRVLDGGSLVYSAPTGGGKTLVAEVLMVRRLLCSNHEGIILWVVPLKVNVIQQTESILSLFLD